MKIPKNKIVKVYWHDHTSEAPWKDTDELKEWSEKEIKKTNYSIGEVVVVNKKYILIASEKNSIDEYGNYTMLIRGCIEKITVL